MSSRSDRIEIPETVASIARRYRRLDRLLSVGVAIVAVLAVGVAFVLLPFALAVLLAIVLLVVLRLPLFGLSGSIELATNTDPETVRADFESETPPVLAFQWASADEVRSTADGPTYEFSYLFGLRSISMTTEVASDPETGVVELSSATGDRAWGTYVVSICGADGSTTVDVELASDRRFELARLTQLVAASRYQPEVLDAQGYAVVDRDRSVNL